MAALAKCSASRLQHAGFTSDPSQIAPCLSAGPLSSRDDAERLNRLLQPSKPIT